LNKHSVIVLLLVLVFLFPAPGFGSGKPLNQESEEGEGKKKHSFFSEFLKEEKIIWTSPARIRKKDALFLGGLALTTALIIKNDEYIIEKIKKFALANPGVKTLGSYLSPLGSAPVDAGLIGIFYLGGAIFKNDRIKETALLSLKSLIHAILVSQVIKLVFRRQRPDYRDGVDHWFNSGIGKEFRSFTSGHTAQVWSIASVVAGMYRDKPMIPILSYSLAALSGLSRVTENEHWTSDVLTGAVLGYLIGRMVIKRRRSRVLLLPELNGNRTGINIVFSF